MVVVEVEVVLIEVILVMLVEESSSGIDIGVGGG